MVRQLGPSVVATQERWLELSVLDRYGQFHCLGGWPLPVGRDEAVSAGGVGGRDDERVGQLQRSVWSAKHGRPGGDVLVERYHGCGQSTDGGAYEFDRFRAASGGSDETLGKRRCGDGESVGVVQCGRQG